MVNTEKLSMREKLEPEEIEFNQKLDALFLREHELPHDAIVVAVRQIEAQSILQSGADFWKITETKRRISEWLLSHALRTYQPQEVCHECWGELIERGFSDHEQKRMFTGIYARCCQMNGEFDAGMAALDPLIAEMNEALARATLSAQDRSWYEKDLRTLTEIRSELAAGIRD